MTESHPSRVLQPAHVGIAICLLVLAFMLGISFGRAGNRNAPRDDRPDDFERLESLARAIAFDVTNVKRQIERLRQDRVDADEKAAAAKLVARTESPAIEPAPQTSLERAEMLNLADRVTQLEEELIRLIAKGREPGHVKTAEEMRTEAWNEWQDRQINEILYPNGVPGAPGWVDPDKPKPQSAPQKPNTAATKKAGKAKPARRQAPTEDGELYRPSPPAARL
jgi:hypothetical protein